MGYRWGEDERALSRRGRRDGDEGEHSELLSEAAVPTEDARGSRRTLPRAARRALLRPVPEVPDDAA